MVHIVDGLLSAPVLVSGAALTAAGIAQGLRRLEGESIPRVGVLSAAFFVASLVHIPIGPSSVHLVMNGLVGLLLGWAAVPALAVGLLLQAVLFGYGGVTALGVNTVNIALPAVLCRAVFGGFLRRGSARQAAAWGAVAAVLAVTATAAMVAASLALSGQALMPALLLVIPAHIPVAVVEGFVTAGAIFLIRQAKPELLEAGHA